MGEPSHPTEKAHFSHLYFPKLMTISEGRKEDCPLNQGVQLLAQLSFHHDGPVQNPNHCRRSTNPPVNLLLHSSLTHELQLLHLRQDLFPNPENALHPFMAEDHGSRFGSADSNPGRFTLSSQTWRWTRLIKPAGSHHLQRAETRS